MKVFWTVVVVSIFCLQGLALPNKKKHSLTAYKAISALSKTHGNKLPQSVRSLELEQFHVSKNIISFRLKGVYIRFEAIGEKNRTLLINGRAFSAKDLRTVKTARRAIKSKFGIVEKRQVTSLFGLLFSEAQADQADHPLYNPYQRVVRKYTPQENGVANPLATDEGDKITTDFEGAYTVYTLSNGVSEEDSKPKNLSFYGEQIKMASDLLIGDNTTDRMSLLSNYAATILTFMDSENAAAMMELTKIGISPSSILAPHQIAQ